MRYSGVSQVMVHFRFELARKPSGSIEQWDVILSMSYSSPMPASYQQSVTWLHSSAVPEFPSIAQWDYTCYGKGDNKLDESICQSLRQMLPSGSRIEFSPHYFQDHYQL